MKRLVRSMIILLFPLTAFSQKEYFIYLQSEAEQPFFVRMEDKTFSSSPGGYLILSKLRDTTHTLVVGFPQHKWPEQRFTLAMRSKDHGYLLKNFAEKGWGLFDLQTMSVQMGAGNAAAKKSVTNDATVSLFTEILSKAANDPSLKEKPVFAAVSEKKTEPIQAVNKTNEPIAANQQQDSNIITTDTPTKKTELLAKQETKKQVQQPVLSKTVDSSKSQPVENTLNNTVAKSDVRSVKEEPTKEQQQADKAAKTEPVPGNNAGESGLPDYERSEVIKKSESSTTDGFGLTFIDKIADFRQDTIYIFIPNTRTILGDAGKKTVDDRKFLDITDDDVKPVQKDATKHSCPAVASESDFFRLRKKMAGEKESEAMINEAKKEFKGRCFSVDQIRNLGNLFLNEAGKFQFYEVAYPNSSDKNGFAVLQAEFRDPYFVHRFKNLVN